MCVHGTLGWCYHTGIYAHVVMEGLRCEGKRNTEGRV